MGLRELTLALSERVFGLLALRDVANDAAEKCPRLCSPGAEREFEREFAATFSQTTQLDGFADYAAFAGRAKSRQPFTVRFAISLRHQDGQRFAEHFVFAITENLLSSVVPGGDVSAVVGQNDPVVCRLNKRPEAILTRAQRTLQPLTLNEVTELNHHRGNQLGETVILFARLAHEELQHRDDFIIRRHRDANACFQAGLPRSGCPWKIHVHGHVTDPGELFGGPDATGQTHARSKDEVLTKSSELFHGEAVFRPGGNAFERGSIGAWHPRLTQSPAGGLAHILQHRRQSGFKILRLTDRQRGGVHEATFFLCALAFSNVDVHAFKADERSIAVAQRARLFGNPHDAAVLAPNRRFKSRDVPLLAD